MGTVRDDAAEHLLHPERHCCAGCPATPVVGGLLREVERFEEDRELLVRVLMDHQRLPPGGCSCGWQRWGQSFARHVLDVWEERCALEGSHDRGETHSGEDGSPAEEQG